jgi:hypothetical protein
MKIAPSNVIPAKAGIQQGAWNVPLQWYDLNGGTRSVGSGVLAELKGLLGRNGMRPSKSHFSKE